MPLEFEIKPKGATLTDTGDSDNTVPYNTYFHDNRFQFVILASELQEAGLVPGDRIAAIKFRSGSSTPGRDLVNLRIRMQNTDMTTSSSWVKSGWTLVFGPATIPRSSITANTWQQYNFVEPFVWDGRNLLIDTSRDDTGSSSNSGGMYVYNVSYVRACGTVSNSQYQWPYDTAPAYTRTFIPQIVLVLYTLDATVDPPVCVLSASMPAPHLVHNVFAVDVTSPTLIAHVVLQSPSLYYPASVSVTIPTGFIYTQYVPPSISASAQVFAPSAAVSATMPRAAASTAMRVSAVPSVQADHRPPQVYARVLPFLNLRTKSKPIVYDQSGKRLAILENAHDIVLTQEINGEDALTFALPATDKKAFYVVPENRVQIEDAEYIIRRVEETHDENGKRMSVYCEAPWYDLMVAGPLTISEWTNVTPDVPMHDILSGTGWTPSVVEITAYRTLKVDQATTNRLAALRKVTEVWGGELEFDTAARRVHLRKEIARRPGIVIAFRKNMRAIQRITDTSDLITRLYAYGKNGLTISSVNNGVPYVENFQYTTAVRVGVWKDTRFVDPYALKERAEEILAQLSKPRVSYVVKAIDLSALSGFEHERFRLGDYVIVYDDELGGKIETRIVRWQYHVDEPWRTEIELSTRVPRLSDYMYDAAEETKELVEDIKDRVQDLEEKAPPVILAGRAIASADGVPPGQRVDLTFPFRVKDNGFSIIYLQYTGTVKNVGNDAPQSEIDWGWVYLLDSYGNTIQSPILTQQSNFEIILVKQYNFLATHGATTIYIPNLDVTEGTIVVTFSHDTPYIGYCRSHYVNIVYLGAIEVIQEGSTKYYGDCT